MPKTIERLLSELMHRVRHSLFQCNFLNPKPTVQRSFGDYASGVLAPLNNCFGFSKRCQAEVVSSVDALHRPFHKMTVPRLIITVVVLAVYCQVRTVTVGQGPSPKHSEIRPLTANGDAPSAIVYVVVSPSVKTTLTHVFPDLVNRVLVSSLSAGGVGSFIFTEAYGRAEFSITPRISFKLGSAMNAGDCNHTYSLSPVKDHQSHV